MSGSASGASENYARSMTGGEALAEMIQAHGAGVLCGMGGFQLLPFYEAVRSLGLNHNLINDERSGVFIADAYARVTGRPGVCDGTLGPGVTNLVTGLVESLNAGVPLVVLAGDTNRGHSWKNMTQECRQVDILAPAVKELIRVEVGTRIPELVRRAYQVATSGRPGPVLLDVPEDICHEIFDFGADDFWIDEDSMQIPSRRIQPDAASLEKAAAMLAGSERPLLLVGGGLHLSDAYAQLQGFAEALNVPVAHTMSGKGAISCGHPLSAGLFGRYTRIANDLIDAADLLITVGCKLGEIATKRFALLPEATPLIHMDIMAEEIGRTARPTLGLWGDAGAGLDGLLAAVGAKDAARQATGRKDYAAEVGTRMAKWIADAQPRLRSDERPVNMARMVQTLNDMMPADSVLVADGGFAGHWTGLLYDTKKAGRTYIADRGLASIGYGLPGAIGASLGAPDRAVVGVTGDGGFNMTIGELETAVRGGAPVTIMVVNNAASGYVKALQHAMYDGKYQSSDLVEVNYANVAKAFGCHGIRVEDPDDLENAVRSGLEATDLPTVIDVVVTRDPAKMLPAVDSRILKVEKGDRPV